MICDHARGIQSDGVWVERVCREHLADAITYTIRSGSIEAMEFWLRYEPACTNPKLQNALIRHPLTSFQALCQLLSFVEGTRFRRVFNRLARERSTDHCLRFLDALGEALPSGLKELRVEGLLAFLESEDHEVRIRAITLLPQLCPTSPREHRTITRVTETRTRSRNHVGES